MAKIDIKEMKSFRGGYWKHGVLDFYYLVNCHFPSDKLLEEFKGKLPILISSYPSDSAILSKNISKWKNKSYFNEKNIILTNGSSEAIKLLDGLIDKVFVPVPIHDGYTLNPLSKHFFALNAAKDFSLDIEEIIKEINKGEYNYITLCNPNNPTGSAVSREEIIKLLDIGINVILDEAFVDFCPENSVEDLIEKYPNLIIVKTVTKTMGLAGLRLGYILTANEKIKNRVRKIIPRWNINSIAEHFIDIFPKYEKEYIVSIRKTIAEREELYNELKKIKYLKPLPSSANFVFCKSEISADKLADYLYYNHNILIRSSLNQSFLKSDRYVRIAVRKKEDNDKLINALINAGKLLK